MVVRSRLASGNFSRVMLAGNLALFKNDCRAEKYSNQTENAERDQSNHQDGHKSLLAEILVSQETARGDQSHF